MHTQRLTMTLLVVGLGGGVVEAEGIWNWTHDASGEGWANVFDGGPPDYEADSTSGPDDWSMGFSALDFTQPGSQGADFYASGGSTILTSDKELITLVDLVVFYSTSLFPGGDLTGGEGEARLSSTIEFIMPADEIEWFNRLGINVYSEFEGSTLVVVENVTQGETILTQSEDNAPGTTTMLPGSAGDLIRITTVMSGSGFFPPGIQGIGMYNADLRMFFTIVPEPGTGLLLAFAALVGASKKRRRPFT